MIGKRCVSLLLTCGQGRDNKREEIINIVPLIRVADQDRNISLMSIGRRIGVGLMMNNEQMCVYLLDGDGSGQWGKQRSESARVT